MSTNKAHALLSQILARAIKRGWLTVKPVLDVGRLREDPATIDPLSRKEIDLLLAKGFPTDPVMKRFYTVAIFTGLRNSGLIGLKWSDIDWTSEPPMTHIKHAYTKLDREHLTKTAGSARAVALRPQALRASSGGSASNWATATPSWSSATTSSSSRTSPGRTARPSTRRRRRLDCEGQGRRGLRPVTP